MQAEMEKKALITAVGGERIPELLLETINALVEKALNLSGKSTDNSIAINFLKDGVNGSKGKPIFSAFVAPNVININLERHLKQTDDMSKTIYLRASSTLWYELLRSVAHELYHMLMEYEVFMKENSNNEKAMQIGPEYDCTKAESWAKKVILALGFESNINPPDEWGTSVINNDWLSEQLSNWQCSLPEKEEKWAKRQQEMIDRNIIWLDDEEKPHITLDTFDEWLAIEGSWEIPVWKVRLESKVKEPVVEETTIPEVMLHTPVNPTLDEMKSVMYHVFMRIYQTMFEKCGWSANRGGHDFTTPGAIKNDIGIKDIPAVELVMANFTNSNKNVTPIWPGGVISGTTFLDGAIPAVKVGVRSTTGNIITYTAIAQNPKKESTWGQQANTGTKSMVVLKDGAEKEATMAIRIIDGVFIANPLSLNNSKSTVVSYDQND